MIKEIITDRGKLRTPCTPVENIAECADLITNLIHTAEANKKNCVALAANQIGESKRVFVIKMIDGSFCPVINPEIISTSKKEVRSRQEMCMSVVNKWGEMQKIMKRRFKKIQVQYTDHVNQTHTIKIGKFAAKVFQHELDHLNGKLISD